MIIFLWWLLCAMAGIMLQAVLPGLDFLLPVYILILQERNWSQSICFGIFFVLLQEGMGSMAFGGTLLLYTFVALAFYISKGYLQGSSWLFVLFVSTGATLLRFALFRLVAMLEEIPWDDAVLMHECLFQIFLTPMVWYLLCVARRALKREFTV